MKRKIALVLAMILAVSTLAACGGKEAAPESEAPASTETEAPAKEETPAKEDVPAEEAWASAEEVAEGEGYNNAELGITNGRFDETKKITVEVYDRGNDGGTDPTTNMFAQFIKDGMLETHNVEVEFVAVPRWTEGEVLNNLLAAGDAPDICVTYSYPTILTYAEMGGVVDIAPLIDEYWDLIPNLVSIVGEDLIRYNEDPNTGKNWAFVARIYNSTGQKTFVREDWLNKLGMAEPTTLEEFEAYLYALKDNAELLLGEEADQMVPYMLTPIVAWHALDLTQAVTPGDLTDKDLYVYGYDDHKATYPNMKEAVRIFNKWYNEGLLWPDFSLYTASDPVFNNMLKAGYVGSYTQNSDEPYRNAEEGPHGGMRRLYAEDAAFIAVNTFKNEDGVYQRYEGLPVDRSVFFPATNDEPVASLMYLDFISRLETRKFLQIGEEGINHEVMEDGSYKILPATGENIVNSQYNIDYTIVNNGLSLDTPEITVKSLAQGYAGVDPKYIERAYDRSGWEVTVVKNAKLGTVEAEQAIGTALTEKRDAFLNKAVVASVADFDAVYDAGWQDYLDAGGQAIIDERTAKWEAAYGDATMLPE